VGSGRRTADGGGVRIISEATIKEFWSSRRGDAVEAERLLRDWIKAVRHADWENFASLRQTFGSADKVGDCVVFDVGNNRYRLIGRVRFRAKIVYILKVMDHAEYDLDKWKDACGCFTPPPPPKKGRKR
jgi:mRNA interferase HigB